MKPLTHRLLLPGLLCLGGCQPPSAPVAPAVETLVTPTHDSAPTPKPADRWKTDVKVNDLDGSKRIVISNFELVLRCAPKNDGYILPPLTNLGHSLEMDGGHEQTVRYRLDQGPLHKERWAISDDLTALFMPRSVLKQLGHSTRMVIEYEPEYVLPETTTIDLTGLGDAEAQTGCKI